MNLFIKVEANHPATDFKPQGWVHSTKRQWWSNLTVYILEHFSGDLKKLGLCEAVRATCYEIEANMPNFYALLELYYLFYLSYYS